jgi:hypothetical protein
MDILKSQMGVFKEDPKAFAGIDRGASPHPYDDIRTEILVLGNDFHDGMNRRLRLHPVKNTNLQAGLP